MYNIIKNVLNSGGFELSDIKKKIDTFWLKGNITDDQHTELHKLAEDGANVQNSVDMLQKLADLEMRIKALEEGRKDTEAGDEPGEEQTIPEFEVGKWYYAGDKTRFNGAVYECTAPHGVVCVWSPSDYPAYWNKVE
jgi:hypothetical protein